MEIACRVWSRLGLALGMGAEDAPVKDVSGEKTSFECAVLHQFCGVALRFFDHANVCHCSFSRSKQAHEKLMEVAWIVVSRWLGPETFVGEVCPFHRG